jgi:hypothetical protein
LVAERTDFHATPTRGQRQSSTPPFTSKRRSLSATSVSLAPTVLKTTIAALAQPPFSFEPVKNQIKHRR